MQRKQQNLQSVFYLCIQSSSSIQPEQHSILRVIHSVSFPADFGHYSSGMRKIVFKVEANQDKAAIHYEPREFGQRNAN